MGLYVCRRDSPSGRLYLSNYIDDTWVPYGDTSGIDIPSGERVDIGVAGRIVSSNSDGRLIIMNVADGSILFDTTVYNAHSILINDSTLLTTESIWKLIGDGWQMKSRLTRTSGVDVIRMSAVASVIRLQASNNIGYIVSHEKSAIVDSLGPGFYGPLCAVYSHRYHGMFVGFNNGLIGFLPIKSAYDGPTSITSGHRALAPGHFTSCTLYSIDGGRVVELACSSQLSKADVASFRVPNGLYVAVYKQDHGDPFTELILVGP